MIGRTRSRFALHIGLGLLTIAILSCAGAPKLQRNALRWPDTPIAEQAGDDVARFNLLADRLRGQPFGDQLFNDNTRVVWVTPKLDIIDLKLAVSGEGFSKDEFEARLGRLREVHDRFLIFSIDLRFPFYPGWSQAELLGYLEKSLVVELRTHSASLHEPVRTVYRVTERFSQGLPTGPATRPVEVSIPLRTFFERQEEAGFVLSGSSQTVELRLSLRTSPPFNIGFFDDKFFHGFRWVVE